MKTPTEIRERWAKVASTIEALGTYVDETLARMDGIVAESASEPSVEPEAQPYQCSCVGGGEEHHHIKTTETGTACIQYVAMHPERFDEAAVELATKGLGAPAPSSPSTPEAAPDASARVDAIGASIKAGQTGAIRNAVVELRAEPANLTTTKAKGLKGAVKKALAERFGVSVSSIGWMDWSVRKGE